MSVGIECPVCEAVFLVKEVGKETGIRCPECRRKFRYSKEILTKKKPAQKANKPAEETTNKTKAKIKPLAADPKPAHRERRRRIGQIGQ